MFAKKPEKDTGAKAAQIEKALGSSMRDLADLSKQKIAENLVGTVRNKRIRSEISEADLRAIVNIVEMSVDQALSTIGSRTSRVAKEIAE
jgi:hypothetical protein